jgi:glycosyltransferase involved in cell wall biosynthesis
MRVALLPDPVLYGQPCGLRTQVRETMDALARKGVHAFVVGASAAPRKGCDLLHVFGAARGNAAVVESTAARMPVVLSPRISPGWTGVNGTRARVADRVLGNLTGWDFDTTYAQIRRALRSASMVVAQCAAERDAICRAFLVAPEQVCVIGCGVGERFFRAEPELFRAHMGMPGRFALMVGQVSPWHGQLDIARRLAALALPLVLIGQASERDADYLRALRSMHGVRWLDQLDHGDPLLASAYAAATLLVLPAPGGPEPLSACEALAAGTPVLAPSPLDDCVNGEGVFQVGHDGAMEGAVAALLADPPRRAAVRATVAGRSWDAVADQLCALYRVLLARPL